MTKNDSCPISQLSFKLQITFQEKGNRTEEKGRQKLKRRQWKIVGGSLWETLVKEDHKHREMEAEKNPTLRKKTKRKKQY